MQKTGIQDQQKEETNTPMPLKDLAKVPAYVKILQDNKHQQLEVDCEVARQSAVFQFDVCYESEYKRFRMANLFLWPNCSTADQRWPGIKFQSGFLVLLSWIIFLFLYRAANHYIVSKKNSTELAFKLSYLNLNFAQTLGYLNPVLNNPRPRVTTGSCVIKHKRHEHK